MFEFYLFLYELLTVTLTRFSHFKSLTVEYVAVAFVVFLQYPVPGLLRPSSSGVMSVE